MESKPVDPIDLLVGESRVLKEIKEKIKVYAKSDLPVFLTGETGVGKGLIAKLIHESGLRKNFRFLKINCSAIPEPLLESELFGHEKGAFTGADQVRVGKFEYAGGGTIFLDEIGESSPAFQSKLLHVIEDKEFERVGGNKSIRLNARIIAATNMDLKEGLSRNALRHDLYYRLSNLSLYIPPLRERKEDLKPLIHGFIQKSSAGDNRVIDKEALKILENYHWPGNVRQLEHVIQWAVENCDETRIKAENLPKEILNVPSENPDSAKTFASSFPNGKNLKEWSSIEEKQKILSYLEKHHWNRLKAAKDLGISRNQLFYRMKKYAIGES